jgi:hypothetical protein
MVSFGSYNVTEEIPNKPNIKGNYLITIFSEDFLGVIHSDETKTRTMINTVMQISIIQTTNQMVKTQAISPPKD